MMDNNLFLFRPAKTYFGNPPSPQTLNFPHDVCFAEAYATSRLVENLDFNYIL